MNWLPAAAALLGGSLWILKGGVILLGYDQPPHAFEVAPLLFALATVGLARRSPPSRARLGGVVLAAVGVVASLVAAVSSLATGDVVGPDLLVGVLATTAALVVLGIALRRRGAAVGRYALLLGVGTVPAVVAGGALSFVDERLLEVPIVALGLGWVALGSRMPRRLPAAPPRS